MKLGCPCGYCLGLAWGQWLKLDMGWQRAQSPA